MEKLSQALEMIGDPTFSNLVLLFYKLGIFAGIALSVFIAISLVTKKHKIVCLLFIYGWTILLITQVMKYLIISSVGLEDMMTIYWIICLPLMAIIDFWTYLKEEF
jgi:hypothetical protein